MSTAVQPDDKGEFSIEMTGYDGIRISRDIAGDYYDQTGQAPDIMDYVNGMDAYYVALVTTFNDQHNGALWMPSPYQMIAADVNMNDKVRANDITLIQQRTLLNINEYPQAWNYEYNSSDLENPVPKQQGLYSYDWRFIQDDWLANADYQVNKDYPVYYQTPNSSDLGFWRDDVPNVDTCMTIEVDTKCEGISNEYIGVMLGDVDGNWVDYTGSQLRGKSYEGEILVHVLDAVEIAPNVHRVAISTVLKDNIHAIDFSFVPQGIQVSKIDYAPKGHDSELNMLWNNYRNGEKVLLTSYTIPGLQSTENVYYMDIEGELNAESFQSFKGYLNGKPAEVKVIMEASELVEVNVELSMYPNPAKDEVTVKYASELGEEVTVELINLQGILIPLNAEVVSAGQLKLNVEAIESGMYIVRVLDGEGNVVGLEKLLVN